MADKSGIAWTEATWSFPMIEIHGLRCTKAAAIHEPGGTEITIQDAPPHICVAQWHCTFPALLTPDEAEWIAEQLTKAAARVRALDPAE